LQDVTKEVVGIHVPLTRSLFGNGIQRKLLRRVSLVKRLNQCLRLSYCFKSFDGTVRKCKEPTGFSVTLDADFGNLTRFSPAGTPDS
jgi:hypothetical protein